MRLHKSLTRSWKIMEAINTICNKTLIPERLLLSPNAYGKSISHKSTLEVVQLIEPQSITLCPLLPVPPVFLSFLLFFHLLFYLVVSYGMHPRG